MVDYRECTKVGQKACQDLIARSVFTGKIFKMLKNNGG